MSADKTIVKAVHFTAQAVSSKIQNYTEAETQKYFQIANAKVFPISPKQNYISCDLCQTEFDYIVLDENSCRRG